MKDRTEIAAAAAALAPKTQCLIDGRFVDAQDGATFDDVNPATGAVTAKVASGGEADIDRAVGAARAAFDDGRWRNQAPRARGQALVRLADLLVKHEAELSLLESVDIGKPIRYTGRVDLDQAQLTFRWYGELADKLYDDIAPTASHVAGLITREPLGVVGAITPWNFPMMITAWKIAPALVTGNSVVLKPAEQSPLTALRLAELALEAGIPAGVLNVVPGLGETAGKALGLHGDVDAVAFTGSTEVGKLLLGYAGQSNMKRVSLETGGKTPNILFADLPDLDYAMRAVGFSVFWNTGEMCVAGSRLLVERSLHDEVVARLPKVAAGWQPGDPLDPKTKAGPLISREHLDTVLGHLARGREEGATVVTGGARTLADSGGYFVEPTVFAGATNEMSIAREEIFGPVVAVIPFDTEAEALAIANDTRYGLSAAVWTGNLSRAHRMARDLRAGTVWVNNFDQADMTAPFGGFKESGFGGKDKSRWAVEKYTNQKTTWINFGKGGGG